MSDSGLLRKKKKKKRTKSTDSCRPAFPLGTIKDPLCNTGDTNDETSRNLNHPLAQTLKLSLIFCFIYKGLNKKKNVIFPCDLKASLQQKLIGTD